MPWKSGRRKAKSGKSKHAASWWVAVADKAVELLPQITAYRNIDITHQCGQHLMRENHFGY